MDRKGIATVRKDTTDVTWFGLVRGENSIKIGFLASAEGISDPFAAAPPAYHSLLQEFFDIFEPPGASSPQQVAHYIDLVDEGAPAPNHRAYRMFPSELS